MTANGATYCPTCGAELVARRIEGRDRPYCPACEQPWYRNPKPCAGTLVVDGSSVLLVQRTQPPSVGSWSVPAGYLEHDEPPHEAAARELEEETGLTVDPEAIDLFDTAFVGHDDGTYVLVVLYAVARAATEGTPEAGSDADGASFWAYDSLTAEAPLEPGYRAQFRRAIERYGDVG
jgi:ADP-ribose pyrophosphatase YjhB (NUDIX family)